MAIPRWSERASQTPHAAALVTRVRTWSCAELADAVRVPLRSPIAIVGAYTAEAVIELCAAIEQRVPASMIHPRWTSVEADDVRARAHAIPEGTLAVVATSGTTGRPKLAVLSRRAFEHAAHASASHLGTSQSDRWLLAMPIAHVGGLGVIVRSLVQRTPIVLADPSEDWLSVAERETVTHVSLVPTMLSRLLDAGARPPSSLRVALVGGAACSDRLLERALAAGWPVHPSYGLTETCGQVATSLATDPRALVALPGVEMRVRDGTIRVRTPSAMDGWLDAASPFDDDGFYDTGDLGAIDARGRVAIFARRTDLIVTGGENVYPAEVERVLEHVPGVRAACVFGVPDESWGQRVAAALVLDAAVDEETILVCAREALAAFKVPRLVARLDALALAASGKLDRAATTALAASRLRAVR